MNAEPATPLETVICGRCAALCEPDDNFCRRCGLVLQQQQLPSVRRNALLPVSWQPRLPSIVVRGAVFIAAGTVAEILARRFVRRTVGRLLGRPASAPAQISRRGAAPANGATPEDEQLVSDTLLLRHIRIRR